MGNLLEDIKGVLSPEEVNVMLEIRISELPNPNYQTCVRSEFPCRVWCSELKKLAIVGVCGNCDQYSRRN